MLTAASGCHLAGCSHLGGLRLLSVEAGRSEGFVGELARSPHLKNLHTLDLSGHHGVTEADADALVRSPLAKNLRCLRLSSLSPAAQKTLLGAKSLSGLTALRIAGRRSSPADGQVGRWLREATHLENLTTLDVSNSQLGDEGLEHLADSPHLASLTSLDVGSNSTTRAGFEALANSPHLGRMRKVVTGYQYGDRATHEMLKARFAEVVH